MRLQKGGCIVVIRNALDKESHKAYCEKAKEVQRIQSPSSFGHMTPRFQAHYHPSSEPYVYSRVPHKTTPYPTHVVELLDAVEEKLAEWMKTPQRDHAVDIEYSDRLPQGGSIAPHSDDECKWTDVVIYSVGQTRTMIIRDKQTRQIVHRLQLTDNSVVLMHGQCVQDEYTHEVPKLPKRAPVGTRYSLNVRYK